MFRKLSFLPWGWTSVMACRQFFLVFSLCMHNLHNTKSHLVAWISSCGWMHVFVCWVVMYSHDCGHLSPWHHASTCQVACIHMTIDTMSCIYMTSTIFHTCPCGKCTRTCLFILPHDNQFFSGLRMYSIDTEALVFMFRQCLRLYYSSDFH